MIFKKEEMVINAGGKLKLLEFNNAQKLLKKIIDKGYKKINILKARQFGASTYIVAEIAERMFNNKNYSGLIIANEVDNAKDLFSKLKLIYDSYPKLVRDNILVEQYNTRDELFIKNLNSRVKVDTSGRSGTYDFVYVSEYPKMTTRQAKEVISGTLPTIERNGGTIILDGTSNGVNHAKDLWDKCFIITEDNYDDPEVYKRYKNEWVGLFLGYLIQPDEVETIYMDVGQARKMYDDYAEKLKLTPRAYDLFEKDSQFLSYFQKIKNYGDEIKQEYPLNPDECWLSSGNPIVPYYLYGDVVTNKPIFSGDGWDIWLQPNMTNTYIFGVDVATGDGSDFSVCAVYCRETGEQVARYRNKVNYNDFASNILMAAEKYTTKNKPLIICERNGINQALINVLATKKYPNLYKGDDGKLGFNMTYVSKEALLLGEFGLKNAIENKELIINDDIFLNELLSFVREENGKINSVSGKNDDTIIAWSLALYGRLKKSSTMYVFN